MAARLVLGGARSGVDAVAVVVEEGGLDRARGLGFKAVESVAGLGDFEARLEQAVTLYQEAEPRRVILAGAGKRGEWFGEAERLRVAVAAAVKEAKRSRSVKSLGILVPEELVEAAAGEGLGQAWALEQALVAADMANYVYSLKSRDKPHQLSEIRVSTYSERLPEGSVEASERAEALAYGVRLARDVANAPPSRMNPEGVEREARRLAEELGLSIKVFHRGDLESMGMGGILAVGAGSSVEPRLIVLEYDGGGETYAVVGKTVTFDSGGLDLKPPQYMLEMKFDKSGGAAALGIIAAAAKLKLPVKLVAVIPAVENMPSGSSYKPLDVLEMYNGLRVEVGNTDAEGRLILADALAYTVEKYKPKAVIDLATLTGAAVIALGNHAAALMGNNEQLLEKVEKAAWRAGEPAWRLPMWPVYGKQLESKVADVNNVGGRPAGAITAAKFLERFVGETPWAHLDIAGVAWIQEKGPWKPYYGQHGATGWGVRTVIELLREETRGKEER